MRRLFAWERIGNMSLSNLYLDAIVACAETGQLTKAAKKLHITQSALSQRIALLEEALGVTLMVRGRAGVSLTPSGFRLLRYCLAKGDLEKEALSEIRGGAATGFRGTVRLVGFSSIVSSIVISSFSEFASEHVEAGFEIQTAQLSEIPLLLAQGKVDFAISDMPIELPGVTGLFLGFEENVLTQRNGYNGPDVYLDHNEHDTTTSSYFRMKLASINFEDESLELESISTGRNKTHSKADGLREPQKYLKRRFLGDIHGLLAGVESGFGRAILPIHLVRHHSCIEILKPSRCLRVPIYLNVKENLLQIPFFEKTAEALKFGFQKILNQNVD